MKTLEISEDSKVLIKSLLSQKNLIDTALNNYINGLKDGKRLDGDYNFDLRTLTFNKIGKKEAK